MTTYKRAGLIERWTPSRRAYRWIQGYALVINGHECQPNMPLREARRLAKEYNNVQINDDSSNEKTAALS